MRCILIDWLVEVHYKFKLVPQTLWMCVNILDRFLGKVPVERTKLQLAGVASLLIACKYEESGPPEVKDCIFITDYSYTRKEILAMESAILTVLDYYLCVPTGYAFLMKYVHAIGANDKLKYLAFYYGERNLQEYDTIDYLPSEYAAACLYAALVQQQQTNLNATFLLESQNIQSVPSVWTEQLVKETGLKESEIKPLASLLVEHAGEEHVTASKRLLIAARKKYSVEKYYYVSNLLQPQL